MARKNTSSVAQLVRLFRAALSELGHDFAPAQLEAKSFLVYRAMTGRARNYHGVEHIFLVARGLPALGRLAVIYHDTVYLQVDRGFLPEIWDKLRDIGSMTDRGRFILSARLDQSVSDVAAVFGFKAGDTISPQTGLNEFLSAVLAMREIGSALSSKEIQSLVCCIEATIPFRGRNAQGLLPTEALQLRLASLGFSENESTETIRLAVRVANSDVRSFSQGSLRSFLSDTWKLLPETNGEFQNAGVYSIRSYLEAISKTEAFLSGLDPTQIFQQYRSVPNDRAFATLKKRARVNLSQSSDFLRAKIVTMSVLEALAELTGGDAPVAYFTGLSKSADVMQHSPFAKQEGLLRRTLGPEGIAMHVLRSQQVRAGEHDWQWFLDGLPQKVVRSITTAVTDLAIERRGPLLTIAGRKAA